jgi:putative peptidoglycan lipid II flippase
VQISAYIDTVIASLLPTGAVTALSNAQLLYTLPISLFGISVSAAELPKMAGAAAAGTAGTAAVRERLNTGLRQIMFFVVPSAVAFIALGDIIVAALLQTETGRFTRSDTVYVWAILAASGIGLLPSTLGRLYSSTFYALRDTRTPLRYALARVTLATLLGYTFAIPLPRSLGISSVWGAAGLALSSGLAGWVEMLMLRRTLHSRIGQIQLPAYYSLKLWAAAIPAALLAWLLKLALPEMHPIIQGMFVLGLYGIVFLGTAVFIRIPEASTAISRLRRRVR